jgi:Type II CAAX prenyl endopeptidase Rce1-like
VPLRWYAISLLAPPLILLLTATALYGRATLRTLGQNWLLTLTSFLPALVVMIVFNSVAEEIGWTGYTFARLQDRHGPLRAALLTTVFFWLYHAPSFYVETRSWVATAIILGFPPAAASSQPIHSRLALQRLRLKRVDRRTLSCGAQRNGESDWLGYRRLRGTADRHSGDHLRIGHCGRRNYRGSNPRAAGPQTALRIRSSSERWVNDPAATVLGIWKPREQL